MRAGFLAPLVSNPDQAFMLRNSTTGAIVATRVEGALDSRARRRGLLGRDGLPEGTALVIAPSNAVHTFFMRFTIDVIFVRRDGRILKVRRGLGRGRLAMAVLAFAVVELAADTPGGSRVARGDQLEVIPVRPANSALLSAAAQTSSGQQSAEMSKEAPELPLGSQFSAVCPG